ncbi:hypothetical protein KUCAC02_027683 [Chaenocephalus aceratus]|uniref:Uncharacterized protein n=1 Tax=Chaenocephalus aceratus TaxID=36190 RepID=A0ACB9W4H9_CHAAC|nr:hypothetical protein KUCAC02_027683 [Chaenocephalus aceratus]
MSASTDPKGELASRLAFFIHLYSQHRDGLQKASEGLTLTAAQDQHEDSSVVDVLCVVTGGFLGAGFGGVTGGVGGACGAVAASTWARISNHINAAEATVGFVGSVLGGVFGGAFSSAIAEEKSTKAAQMLRKTAHFCETFKPLVTELNTIKNISEGMASRAQGVAEQSAKTLASVNLMLKATNDSLPVTDLTQFVSSAEEWAQHGKRITEELGQMNEEGETCWLH